MPLAGDLVNGEEVIVSIRPEKVRITDQPWSQNCFAGKVESTVYIGSNTHLVVHVGEAQVKVWEQNRISRLDPKSFYSVGQEVNLVLMPENTLVLKKS